MLQIGEELLDVWGNVARAEHRGAQRAPHGAAFRRVPDRDEPALGVPSDQQGWAPGAAGVRVRVPADDFLGALGERVRDHQAVDLGELVLGIDQLRAASGALLGRNVVHVLAVGAGLFEPAITALFQLAWTLAGDLAAAVPAE